MLEIIDRSFRRQVSSNQGGLYSTPICRHDHSSSIADRHNSIRIGPGERSIDWKAIPNHRSLVPTNQTLRSDRVLLDEPGEEIAYLPVSPDIWLPDPDSDVCPSVSLRDYPSVSSRRISWIHVHLCDILLDIEIGHQILYVRSDR